MSISRTQKYAAFGIIAVALISACQAIPETLSNPTQLLPTKSTVTAIKTATVTTTNTPSPTASPTPTALRTSATSAPSSEEKADIIIDFTNSIGHAPPTFGVNGWWTDEDATMWQQRYTELAPQVVRLPVFHAVVEPQNDNTNPTSINWDGFHFDIPYAVGNNRHITYHKWFSALKEADVTVMIFIPYLAPWLSKAENPATLTAPYPPTDMAEYEELIQALLVYLTTEIGFSPEKIIIEPANEPDLKCGGDATVTCFWQNWTMSELAAVFENAAKAVQATDPFIRIAGPAFCCRGDIVEQLMSQHDIAQYLDIITFHSYGQGRFNLNPTLSMTDRLRDFNMPIYLDEYGNRSYWSNGEKGALWHAAALGEFWKEGLVPIQFSMAEVPWMHTGYNELGLFQSWEENWQIKPAYWVYVNFFEHMQDVELVSFSSPVEMPGIAGKADNQHLAIWVTNATYDKEEGVILQVENWSLQTAKVQVLNNLTGSSPIDEFQVETASDSRLTFSYPISTLQSLLFLISAPENQ